MNGREGCPSCDRDLSYPGQLGHACYTYAQQAANIARNQAEDAMGCPIECGCGANVHGTRHSRAAITRGAR